MNEHELWEQSVYDEAWASVEPDWVALERAEHQRYLRQYRWWRVIIVVWIVISVAILIATIAVKFYNSVVGQ